MSRNISQPVVTNMVMFSSPIFHLVILNVFHPTHILLSSMLLGNNSILIWSTCKRSINMVVSKKIQLGTRSTCVFRNSSIEQISAGQSCAFMRNISTKNAMIFESLQTINSAANLTQSVLVLIYKNMFL